MMSKIIARLTCLAILSVLALFTAALSAQDTEGPGVVTVPVDQSIPWVSSVEWDADRQRLLVVDPAEGAVHSFQMGEKAGAPWLTLEEDSVFGSAETVTEIVSTDNRVLVRRKGDEYGSIERRSLRNASASPLDSLTTFRKKAGNTRSIFAGWEASGRFFVGFGSVSNVEATNPGDPARGFSLGILLGRVGPAGSLDWARVVQPVASNNYYRVDLRYFAHFNNAFYAVVMEEPVRILRIPVGGAVASFELPEPWSRAEPVVTEGSESMVMLHNRLERSTFAAGVFAWDEQLWLLGRKATASFDDEASSVQWTMMPILSDGDFGADAELGDPVVLPSDALHLIPVPAGDKLFLIERGKVQDYGKQDGGDILILSAPSR